MERRFAPMLLLFLTANVCGQSIRERESLAIAEIGVSPSWNIPGFGSEFSPTVAVEFTPVERWLEIEIGTAPTFDHHSTEWVTDALFKKPWTLSRKTEFMFGVGPELIHRNSYGATSNSLGAEVALDFMFWPAPERRFGWYLEPAYEYSFGREHDQSISISGGLLIKIP